MTTIDVAPVSTHLLTVTAARSDQQVTITLKGEADLDAIRPLNDFLTAAHAQLCTIPQVEVIVDVRELEFMNSSCLKCLIAWLRKVQQLKAKQQYRIRFLSDSTKHWQRRSLDALRCFAADLVEIES